MTAARKTFAAGLAALALAGAVSASSPAAAGPWRAYHPWGWGVGAAAAGIAIGAAAAAATPYYYAPACYFSRQPVVDAYGEVVGFRRVRVCN
ncbi:hypothetical protein [Methylocella sp.]|uniref:hypothetical protein n=1 Tax=Methylocella sp. TaxID=1978226 RepID=UPI00378351B9